MSEANQQRKSSEIMEMKSDLSMGTDVYLLLSLQSGEKVQDSVPTTRWAMIYIPRAQDRYASRNFVS